VAGMREEPGDPTWTSVGWDHPGLPGSGLDADLVGQLPASTPGPPWHAGIEAVLWVHGSRAEAAATLPPGREARFLGPTIAGFVHYTSSPVGSYHEVLASPVLVRGGLWRLHVPFIAVDSLASLHAGRVHWALPKTLASFTGSPVPGSSITAQGDGWQVRAAITAAGPALPVRLRVSLAQWWPVGGVRSFPVTFRGRLRVGRVHVEVAKEAPVAGWLRSGRHLAVCLSDARMTLPPPRGP
jgi:hypothetical protein